MGLILSLVSAIILIPAAAPSEASAAPGAIARMVSAMTPSQKAGELLMIAAPASGDGLPLSAIRRFHFGSVLLMGNTGASPSAVHRVTSALRGAAGPAGSLLIATDQEGGYVQRLRAPGFRSIPTALAQSRMGATRLRAAATGWGRQMRAAGVNLDLAPDLDVVPHPSTNPPIGQWQREYGSTPQQVIAGSQAFASGLTTAGVGVCGKHFPGLGLVHANTDVSSGVTDTTIGPDSSYLAPFRRAVHSGFPFMMMSTAIYQKLDPGVPAAFSHKIVTGLLRRTVGFRGVVVSDSLDGVQVRGFTPAARAWKFVQAGGDLIITTSLNTAIQMHQALVAAQSRPAFRALVNASVSRILAAKADLGLKPFMVGSHVATAWTSTLGQPLGPEISAEAFGTVGYLQRFRGGAVLISSHYGTFQSFAAIGRDWTAASNGWPLDSTQYVTARGWSGTMEDFAQSGGHRARVYGRSGSVQTLPPGVLTKFSALGGLGTIGWPVSTASDSAWTQIGRVQRFQSGTAIIRSADGIFASSGLILADWSPATRGWPTSDIHQAAVHGHSGDLQTFQRSEGDADYAFLPAGGNTVQWIDGPPA